MRAKRGAGPRVLAGGISRELLATRTVELQSRGRVVTGVRIQRFQQASRWRRSRQSCRTARHGQPQAVGQDRED